MKPILIVVSTFNRKSLTGFTLDNIKRNKSDLSDVVILDDASTEYDDIWLAKWGWPVFRRGESKGVGAMAAQRYQFYLTNSSAPYVLCVDNDLAFAPGFDIISLETFHQIPEPRPSLTVLSPYYSNTVQVTNHIGQTLLEVKTVNGCAQFTDREGAKAITEAMKGKWQHPWDARISDVLKGKYVPIRSLVQHIGIYGDGVNGPSTDTAVDFVGSRL